MRESAGPSLCLGEGLIPKAPPIRGGEGCHCFGMTGLLNVLDHFDSESLVMSGPNGLGCHWVTEKAHW